MQLTRLGAVSHVRLFESPKRPLQSNPGNSFSSGAVSVSFSGVIPNTITPEHAARLFQQFGVQPEQVSVVYGPHLANESDTHSRISQEERSELLARYLFTLQQTQGYRRSGNLTGDYYGAAVQLQDGSWGQGLNVEISRQDTLCGERVSIIDALNGSLHKQIEDESGSSGPMKIKQILLSTVNLGQNLAPCSECQGWMGSDRVFDPQTRVINLIPGEQPNQYRLWVRSLQDLLPYWGQNHPSTTNKPISQLPVRLSDQAKHVLKQLQANGILDESVLKRMVKKAKAASDSNHTVEFTRKRLGAAVYLSSGHIVSDARFEWHKRLIDPPELRASAYGLMKVKRWRRRLENWCQPLTRWLGAIGRFFQKGLVNAMDWTLAHLPVSISRYVKMLVPPEPVVKAVAYYGEAGEDIPNVKSLGYLAKKNHGGPDTLIITVEHDQLMVRTIRDYMPELYISATDRANFGK
jgi:cytidine deaminase